MNSMLINELEFNNICIMETKGITLGLQLHLLSGQGIE